MTGWSRRKVIAGGACVIAAAGAGQAFAQAGGPIRVRRNAAHMAANDPDLLALAAAMRNMMGRPAEDPLSWETQVALHAVEPQPPGVGGQHNSWRFLPWHRAQIWWFEQIVARLSGKADFAMPYWDWVETGRMPALFTNPRSPFYHAARDPRAATLDFVANYDVLQANRANVFRGSFFDFTGTPDASGTVESAGHAYVHIKVDGDMGYIDRAPRDPLFFFHHCNIDRVWATWQPLAQQRGEVLDPDWMNEVFDGFVNADGNQAAIMGTAQLLSTQDLGYRYDAPYPVPFFDEQPVRPPVGKTRRIPVSVTPHKFVLTLEPDIQAPVRLPLPADLVAQLAGDPDHHFAVSGNGRVRSSDPAINGSGIRIAVERILDNGALDPRPMAFLMPFVGHHGEHAAVVSVPAGTAPGAPVSPPVAAMPGMVMPAATSTPASPSPVMAPHQHSFLFAVGPELYNLTGETGKVVEMAVTATTSWVRDNAAPPPTLSGLELDLTITEYEWV